MKNHISVKFAAIILCALFLMTSVGSAAGIGVLAAADLYNHPVETVYNENFENVRAGFANSLVFRFASMDLGGCSSVLVDQYYDTDWFYYSTFRWGSFAYAVRDSKGNVIASSDNLSLPNATHYEIPVVNGSYIAVVPQHGIPAPALREEEEGLTFRMMPEEQRISTIEDYTDAFPYEYYDYMQDETMRVWLCYRNTSEYTVDLYLQPDAMENYQTWVFLGYLWNWRNQLFVVLGVSLLIFSVFAVYLCCAAGRKPGTRELRPTAINRTPLDFYALGVGAILLGLLYLNLRIQYQLIRRSLLLAVTTAAASCFISSLLLVGLGFAFAAQVKAPGGFWWRNSLTGRILLILRRLLIWSWKNIPRLVRGFFAGIRNLLKRLWGGFLGAGKRLGAVLGLGLRKAASLLPMTWQWILVGGIMIFDLVVTISTGDLFFVVLGLIFCLVVVLYGAMSFGTLLDSAHRMHRGDLATKVDDQYLLGCFQDFAHELNGIADVAVVANEKQLRSERMKTELITNVSHDIKTPLTSIINYVDLLQRPHTEQQQTAWLEVLSRQSHSLKKLIDDLMEMSKAASGNLTVEIIEMDAAEAVNQALGEFSDKLEKAHLTPVFRSPEIPVRMQADGRLSWRVISNLLGNAVKYAMPGTRLYIDVMELDGKVLISMKNISREALNVSSDELLERFVRGDASRNTEGSGLGLNIAKTLMELQHGQLELLVDGDLFKATLIFPSA